MSFETDLLIDRRRLKRRLFFWRMATVVVVVAAIGIAVGRRLPHDHVARLAVTGPISDTTKEIKALEAMANDPRAGALIVNIASPGGGVFASQALYEAIAKVAEKKPVVAVMGSTAASGGFMVAMAARRIYANPTTLTGSIGVILQTPEFSGLMAKLGVTTDIVASGPLKDQPNPTHPLSPQGRAELQAVVTDLYDQFVSIVAKGRHMDEARVRAVADGRVFTGRQALELGMVDALGDESDARSWLVTQGIPKQWRVEDLRLRSRTDNMLSSVMSPVGDLLKTVLYQGLVLDAAQALWHPSASD